ncbi:MAG TPA: hypothetical protein VGP94_09185 [Tepidisphaeraceae bacterium]|jgi:hypothetical protein|nr:hypothetical protein [Tepidisphaeraceae bacterium]
MGFILLLLFVALLFLLCMLALIFTAAASVMGRERPLHQEEPTCGGCGYIVKNIDDAVCNVCHAEFKHVGIVMPPPPSANSAAAAWLAFRRVSGLSLGIWTVVAGIVTLGLTVWAGEHFLPFYSESVTHVEIRPKSTGYDSALMTITHRRRANGRMQQEDPINLVKTVVLDLKMAKGSRTLQADLLAPSLTYIGGTGKTVTSVAVPSQEVLVDFMKSAGITIDRQVTLEASSIAKMLNDPQSIEQPSSDQPGGNDLPVEILAMNVDGGAWEASMPLAFLVIPSAAFLWLLGVGVISFCQRGRRAALREQILSHAVPLEIPWEFSTISKDVIATAAEAEAAINTAAVQAKVVAANAASAAKKEAGPAPAGGSSVPPAKTDPAKAA